jgi:ADP-heptose:LPS heptosyltransferase
VPPESVKAYLGSNPFFKPLYRSLKYFKDRAIEHFQTINFLTRTVLPIILRTGARPVLFFRYVGMGDIICTFPAVEQLKKRHPNRVYIYSCYPEFVCLPRMARITSEVVSLRIDIIKTYWSFLFTEIYTFLHDDEPGYKLLGGTINEVSVIKDFARQHQVDIDDSHPRLQVEPAVLDRVKSLLEKQDCRQSPLIVAHCGPSWRVREFPHESWAALIESLRIHGFTNIVQLGTNDHSCLGPVGSMVFPDVVSLVDQLTLEESIALISLGQLFIGIDSGLLHVAASLRTSAVGIFGATSPQYRFSKIGSCTFVMSDIECQGCHHREPRLHWESGCPFDVACMKTLRVESVLEKCLSRLTAVQSNDGKVGQV